jgi:hypothetical protein
LITCLFVLPAHAKYSGGTGEPNDPYQIATAEDLMLLGETPEDYGKHFILTADIDLDPNLPGRKVFDRAVIAPDTNDAETGFQGTPFTGVFDGNAHKTLHLSIVGKDYLGLFGQLASPAQVRELGVVGVNILGSGGYVGGLVGRNIGGAISFSYSTGSVSGDTPVGGLVGQNGEVISGRGQRTPVSGYIDNCYSTCSITGTATLGGLVGFNYVGTITTCYSAGSVSGNEQVGGLVGQNNDRVIYCFWDVETSGLTVSAGGVGKITAEMQTANTFLSWGACGPVWTIDEGRDYPHLAWENLPGVVITGPTYGGGSGTLEDPYLIYTAEELNMIGLSFCDRDKHFKLMTDIDLSGIDGKDGRPAFNIIGTSDDNAFTGVFDGNGHTILHLTIVGEDNLGLFGYLGSGAEVRDLAIVDVSITSAYSAGGLVVSNGGTVTQCYSTGAVSGTGEHSVVGGLVGGNGGTVIRCYSTASVNGISNVGGLVGYNSGTVTHCYSTGVVNGSDSVGGLVGQQNYAASVTHCYSTGPVNGTSSIGGLVGGGSALHSVWDIETSRRLGSAGGVGLTTAEMIDPYMLGLNGFANDPNWVLDAGQDYPRLAWQGTLGETIPEPSMDWIKGGGLVQNPYQIVTTDQLILLGKASILWDKHFVLDADINLDPNLPNARFFSQAVIPTFMGVFDGNGHVVRHLTIRGESYLGLFGRLASSAEVKNLGVLGVNITGSGSYVAGLVGQNGGDVIHCYSTGVVSGSEYVGALLGYNTGTVAHCYNTGSVSGEKHLVGGLAGDNRGTLTACYNTGSVSGASFVGGLAGGNNGWTTQCYSTGSVSGASFVGGMVGHNPFGRVTNCYSSGSVNGTSMVGGLVGFNLGDVNCCYSAGAVKGISFVGGLVGAAVHVVTASFWDGGGTGKTTAEMQTPKTFLDAGWDFVGETANGTEDIWWINEGKDYPRLWWELPTNK